MKFGERNENEWFWDAVETKPERGALEVQGANVNFFSWSEEGPGLFFVHGHNAHAGWWDFIAPFFKSHYKVVASDLSGMGDSDHRDAYDCRWTSVCHRKVEAREPMTRDVSSESDQNISIIY